MDTQKLTNSSNSLTGSGVQLVKERNRSSNKVKLCGYLKKKRNKVGGWRKMWFVLQDKLLLSYASKEEYDNKLVSFKDVLNLVPGTMVRPMGGFRFTIETTTHVMYTFHCDDRNAYREWITMLLDSLSATTTTMSNKIISANSSTTAYPLPIQQQRFRNTSVDNIPHALWSNVGQNSQRQRELSASCDSMRRRVELMDAGTGGTGGSGAGGGEYAYLERRSMANIKTLSNGMKSTSRSLLMPALSLPIPRTGGGITGSSGGGAAAAVRLPIARSTAKLLERNGVNSSGPMKKQQQQQQLHYQKRQKQQQQQQQQKQQQVNCCNRSSGTTGNATSGKSGNNNNNNNNNMNNNNNYNDDNIIDGRLTTEASTTSTATHFRLHGESSECDEFTTLDNGQSSSCAGSSGVSTTSSCGSSSTSASAYHQPVNYSVLKINKMFQKHSSNQSFSSTTAAESASISRQLGVVNKEYPHCSKSTTTNCDPNELIPKYKLQNNNKRSNKTYLQSNKNSLLTDDVGSVSDDAADSSCGAYSRCIKDSQAMVAVKDQIQRLNIKGRKETLSYASTDAPVERHECRRVVVTKHLEEESIIEQASNMNKAPIKAEVKVNHLDSDDDDEHEHERVDDEERQQLVGNTSNTTPVPISNRSSEPIYAVVDLAHKYAERQKRIVRNNSKSLDANLCRSYESIIQRLEPANGVESLAVSKTNIHSHEDDIDGIYEDGDNFAVNCANGVMPNVSDDDENIYEPVGFEYYDRQKINAASTHQPNAFWRYITRLKVNSLLQFSRMRRNNHVDYDTIQLSTPSSSPTRTAHNRKTATLTNNHSFSVSNAAAKTTTATSSSPTTASQFASIKRKFGVHRKSMQIRVRKICARNYEPKTSHNNISGNKQAAYQPANGDDGHFKAVNSAGGVSNGGVCVGGASKKSKFRWKSVKIRPKHSNGGGVYNGNNSNSSTADEFSSKTMRQSFFGSLPHLRKARVSLFSTPNLHFAAKDQNSNVRAVLDKVNAVETSTAVRAHKVDYDELNESS